MQFLVLAKSNCTWTCTTWEVGEYTYFLLLLHCSYFLFKIFYSRFIFSSIFVETFRHSVWKIQKKSHSTLRAKVTFWGDKSWLKMTKMVHFGEFLKSWSSRSDSVTRQKLVENAKRQKFKWDIFTVLENQQKCCNFSSQF